MKKTTAIFLSVFYLVICCGVAVNFHYCKGDLTSVSLFTDASSCCCEDDANDDPICCDDQSVFIDASDEINLNNTQQLTYSNSLEKTLTPVDSQRVIIQEKTKEYELLDLPPPMDVAIYVLTQSLLFYE